MASLRVRSYVTYTMPCPIFTGARSIFVLLSLREHEKEVSEMAKTFSRSLDRTSFCSLYSHLLTYCAESRLERFRKGKISREQAGDRSVMKTTFTLLRTIKAFHENIQQRGSPMSRKQSLFQRHCGHAKSTLETVT